MFRTHRGGPTKIRDALNVRGAWPLPLHCVFYPASLLWALSPNDKPLRASLVPLDGLSCGGPDRELSRQLSRMLRRAHL